MIYSQQGFDIRCEWGSAGLNALLADSDAVAIVDVLSFSTCVDIAVSRGAVIYPYHLRDESATTYAQSVGALLASRRREVTDGYSLSPASLQNIPAGTRLVLPSPNGATLSLMTGSVPTFAGCLRNARSVALAMQKFGSRLSVIPAGEHWLDGSQRFALEDLLGAGAIIHCLQGTRSPEAQAAEIAFLHLESQLATSMQHLASAKELAADGFATDVQLASELNQSSCAPVLKNSAYTSF